MSTGSNTSTPNYPHRQGEYVVMVMEYADGGDLLQLLARYNHRLPEQTAALVMSQVSDNGHREPDGCRDLPFL